MQVQLPVHRKKSDAPDCDVNPASWTCHAPVVMDIFIFTWKLSIPCARGTLYEVFIQ